MKVKINKRLIKLALISFLTALILTFFLYSAVKKASQPERTEKIAYFKVSLDRDSIIKSSDLELKDTPVSLIPEGAVRDISQLKDKRLTVSAARGDFALSDKFISRGDINIDVNDMWMIGIDVENISNYLGVQLKEGDYYGLVYIGEDGKAEMVDKVKVVNVVDSTGRIITETGSSLPKTINIAVNSIEKMKEIAQKKRTGFFEIVKPNENWTFIDAHQTTSNRFSED